MDSDRRTKVRQAVSLLRELQPQLEQAVSLLAPLVKAERREFDALPDHLKTAEREDAAGWLEDAFVALDDFDLEDVVLKLEDARDVE